MLRSVLQVNLPFDWKPHDDNPKSKKKDPVPNSMLIETWGSDQGDRFEGARKETFRPCHTRPFVDEAMISKQQRLEELFPDFKGKFKRDAKVIIDGYTVCSPDMP